MRNKIALTALASVGLLAICGAAQAQETTTTWKGAPQFQNDDAMFKIRGRILVDAVFQDIDRGGGTVGDVQVRNLRGRQMFLGVEGQLNSRLAYKLEGGAVQGGSFAWDDAVIEYKPTDFTSVQVGNVKAFSLENLTSTRFRTFMEQGALGELTEANYNLGVVAKTWGQNYTLSAAIQGDSLNSGEIATTIGAGAVDAKERLQFIVRGTFAPILTDTTKVHLGLCSNQRARGTENGFNYQTKANTSNAVRYTSSGAFGQSDTTIGAEFIAIHKNLSFQAEYANIDVKKLTSILPENGSDGSIQTGYAFVSWFPTGDMRNYDVAKGEIGRPKIKNPITAGGWGGVELAARYDYADLTELAGTVTGPAQAGKYKSYTVGANYYPTSYVRLMVNYTHAESENVLLTNSYDQDILQFRTQLDF